MSESPRSAVPAPARIGIIGDVHAEHELLERALDHFTSVGVDLLLCTGDIVDGPGDPDRCCELLATHGVQTVGGNHERWLLTDKVRHVAHAHRREELAPTTVDYLAELPKIREFQTIAGPLMLCHGVAEQDMVKVWPGSERLEPQRSARFDELLATGEHRWLVNGHMHYRTLVHFTAMTFLNAGTLSRRHRPGLTLLDLAADRITAFEFQGIGTDERIETVVCRSASPAADEPVWADTQAFCGTTTPIVLYRDQPA